MKRSKAGWRPDDVARLLTGFGFEAIEGGKHRLYIHPVYPELRMTVTRSSPLPIGYVAEAVKLVEFLRQRAGESNDDG
jgi:hypothetical protein